MILCCGEALIDMIPEATSSGSKGFVPHPGGAIYNTAIALGRLGAPSAMLTALSTDIFGKQLYNELEASNVDISHVIFSDQPTTLAFVQLTGGQASYSFYDENSAGRMLTSSELPLISQDINALYCGGISLACEPCSEAYMALLERDGKNRVVMFDPNVRTNFIDDAERYRARIMKVISFADIVKVSDEDLDWIIYGPSSSEEKAKSVLELGASLVILTRGNLGATAYCKTGLPLHVPAEKTDVIDTVGAGDTFNAGVLSKLSELGCLKKESLPRISPNSVERALRFGAKVAGVTVSRAGANPPWAEEL
ncbi:MAG: carbohydrate kinase [Rhodobacteraceae bacterium]|jgi:fructokinase|nr:carbohydrate kinase [Marinovum sp.]MBT5929665.1 carbohydrate kinase [Paracoccaceae bacterium]MBT6532620.1 carbohydrate kinase [Marinovum sp.]